MLHRSNALVPVGKTLSPRPRFRRFPSEPCGSRRAAKPARGCYRAQARRFPAIPRFHDGKFMSLTRFAVVSAPVLFVLLWSTGFIGARYGLPYIEPFTFLAVRMGFVVVVMGAIALATRARWPRGAEIGHSLVAASLVHGAYLGGVFIAISQGVPAGISALIPGLQPILTSTIANRFMGEKVTPRTMVRSRARVCRRAAGAARPQHRAGRLAARLDRERRVAHRHHARCALSEALLRRDRLARRQHRAIYRRRRAVHVRRLRVRDAHHPVERRIDLRASPGWSSSCRSRRWR